MKASLNESFYNRYLVLNQLYEKVGSNKDKIVNLQDLSLEIGIKNGKFLECYGYLTSDSMIKYHFPPYKVSITHLGIRQVEQMQLNPDKRIGDFPSLHEMDLA